MTKEVISLIKSRAVKYPQTTPSSVIQLFYSNKSVDAYNILKIASVETEGYIVDAIDEVTDPGNEMGNKGIVKK